VDAIDDARGRGRVLGVIFLDLDTFKEVNDTLGPATGDRLLLEVRERVQGLLPEGSTLARFGGDQFAVLLPNMSIADEASVLAETLASAFDTPFTSEGVSLALGASIGVALYPEHASTAEILLQRADAATYVARLERSGVEIYSTDRDPYAPRRLALAADLKEAIDRNEVMVYVQPKLSVADGVVRGAEALVRWRHPRLGDLSPVQFIPAAEHTGVIRALTLYVVRGALEQCRDWRASGNDLTIAVNLSARNLLDQHLVEDIGLIIEEMGLPPSVLTLELTESTVMSESKRSMEVLNGLHDLGVGLSVDDFGTGYSSLSHLRRLPVSELKIDRSFVASMTVNEHDAVIVRSLVELSKNLGLRTVAEGVENTDAWDRLRDFDCEQAQGFLISRPLPAEQFVTWLVGTAGNSSGPDAPQVTGPGPVAVEHLRGEARVVRVASERNSMKYRHMSRWRWLLCIGSLALGSCGGGGDRAPDASSAPTQSSTSIATGGATSTSTAATEEALNAYLDYWAMVLRVNNPPNPADPEIQKLTTGRALVTLIKSVQENDAAGVRLQLPDGAKYRHRVEVRSIGVDTASIYDCLVDDINVVAIADGVVRNDKLVTREVLATLAKEDGRWKVFDATRGERWEGIAGCAA
jgi:diguanylate cyclase (GGDEF)-like protein